MVQLSEEAITLWTNMLSDIPFGHAIYNLEHHIKTIKYSPTIAEIRGNALETDAERMKLETQERFLLMGQWEKNAGRPLLPGGEANE